MGAKAVKSPQEVARASEVIISVVRDSAQTDEVMFGPEGVWEGLNKDSIIIIYSTVAPSHCQRLAVKAEEKGVSVLDAPVSRGSTGSEARTLTFMVGGDEKVFKECLPIFQAMGKNIFHLGGIGMGQVFKLVNNMTAFVNMFGVSESVAFGLKAGLKLDRMLEVIKASSGNSWVVQNYDLMVKNRKDYQKAGFDSTDAMMYRDMDLALAYARELKTFPLPIIGLLSQFDCSTLFPEEEEA